MAKSDFDAFGWTNHKPIAYTIVAIPILSIYVVYVVSTQALFMHRALVLRDAALLRRSVMLLTVQAVFGLVFTINAMLRFMITNYPCVIELWLTSLGYITWLVAFLLSMIHYYYIFKSHSTVAKETRVNPVTPDNLLDYLARIEETAKKAYYIANSDGRLHPASRQEPISVPNITRANTASTASIAPWQLPDNADALPSRNNSPQDHESDSVLVPDVHTQGAKLNRIARLYKHGKERWKHLPFQTKCFVIGFGVHCVVLFVYLVLATSLFDHLSLKRLHYNCFFNLSLLPHTIFSGLFNIIIGPSYIAFIWRYKDAYGIRTSMCVLLAAGAVFWACILAWRLDKRLRVRHISTSFGFSFQIIIAHTAFVVIPLVKSIRFANLKKRGLVDSALEAESHRLYNRQPDTTYLPMELNKQSFFETMRTPEGHERIEKYAQVCFCPELSSFLDVYVAFKGCIFNELKQKYTVCDKSTEDSSQVLNTTYNPPAIHIVGSSNSSLQISPRTKDSGANTGDMDTPIKDTNTTVSLATSQPSSSNRISCKHTNNSAQYLALSKQDSATSTVEIGAVPDRTESWQIADIAEADDSAACALQCISIGIARTMHFALPQADDITCMTSIPQSLRRELSAIIKTFMLPTSALEINLTAEMVSAAQAYMEGSDMTFGMLDSIKDHVVELLYTNVYIRLYQEIGSQ